MKNNKWGFWTSKNDIVTTATLKGAKRLQKRLESHNKVRCSKVVHRRTNAELMNLLESEIKVQGNMNTYKIKMGE